MPENLFRGLQFSFKRSSSPVAYCALSVRTGTRNENPEYNGLAHLTEHMIFKGTDTRSATSINSYIERLGGELNAYTTKEETVVHATVLKEDISKAIGLLTELCFRSTFPDKELEKEKIVVLDEKSSYKDSPSDQIFDDFEEYLFEGHSLAMPVLGKTKSLKNITVDVIRKYYKEAFIPQNMSFTVVADLDEKHVRKIVLAALLRNSGLTEDKNISTSIPINTPDIEVRPFDKIIPKRNHQVHCIIGASAYSYFDKRRFALILMINILGGPAANSRLNVALREKNAMVYNVEASYNQYSDTGAVTIYFGCDKAFYEKCTRLVYHELNIFKSKCMSTKSLNSAKKQLLGQLAISSDNGEAQCLSMGKSLLVFGEIMENEQIRKRIEAITPQEIYEVANDIFANEKISKLVYM